MFHLSIFVTLRGKNSALWLIAWFPKWTFFSKSIFAFCEVANDERVSALPNLLSRWIEKTNKFPDRSSFFLSVCLFVTKFLFLFSSSFLLSFPSFYSRPFFLVHFSVCMFLNIFLFGLFFLFLFVCPSFSVCLSLHSFCFFPFLFNLSTQQTFPDDWLLWTVLIEDCFQNSK